jgi:hypothetical protein
MSGITVASVWPSYGFPGSALAWMANWPPAARRSVVHFVRQVVGVFEDHQPRHQPGRQRRRAAAVLIDGAERRFEKPPISRASFTSAWFMSMIWSSRDRNRSNSSVS